MPENEKRASGDAKDDSGTSKSRKHDGSQTTMELPPQDTPKPVRGGKMLAKFVRAHFDRDAKDEPLCSLELSFPLTKDHEDMLPPEVEAAWKVIKRGNVKRIDPTEINPQTIGLSLADDMEDTLTIIGARIEKASLSEIEESGAGKTKKIIRYSFRIGTDRTKDVIRFATTYDGKAVWFSSKQTQKSLLDK